MNLKKLFIVLAVALLLVFIATYFLFFYQKNFSPAKRNIGPFAIGILSSDEKVIAQYKAFADYLNKFTGIKWYIEPVIDAGSFIEQIENKKIKAAFAGSAAGYRIIKNNLGVPVARGEKNGISAYYSYIIARKDSGIDSIDDLKNKRFAYTDINMTSGYIFPAYLLKTKGYDVDTFFAASSFLGTTEKVLDGVISGNFDGGAIKDLDLSAEIEKNPGIENNIKIIAQGGPYPSNTFMLSVDFDKKTVNNIQTLLLNMNDSKEGEALLETMNIDRFIKSDNRDFNEVEKIMNF